LLEGFDFGAPAIRSQLTGTLAPLKHYNALRISPDYFDEAINRLRTKFLTTTQKAAANAEPAVREIIYSAYPVEKASTAKQWFERAVAAANPTRNCSFAKKPSASSQTYRLSR
jgi:hypothetical protein